MRYLTAQTRQLKNSSDKRCESKNKADVGRQTQKFKHVVNEFPSKIKGGLISERIFTFVPSSKILPNYYSELFNIEKEKKLGNDFVLFWRLEPK